MLMRKEGIYAGYHDFYEYHGNTEIEMVRKKDEEIIRHDWLLFNSVDEAMKYFNDECGQSMH